MGKDYYKILGLTKSASKDEVKRAFRKLAHVYHPDKPGGNAEKFKEASEAYSVLSDDKKRAEYDAYGRVFSGGQSGGQQNAGGFGFGSQEFDFGDIFGDFGDIFSNFTGQTQRRTQRGRDISIDIEISFRDSIFGTTRKVLLTKTSTCDACRGTGGKPGTEQVTCTVCNGNGKMHETKNSILGTFTSVRVCESCRGTGKIPKEKCSACKGSGVVRKEQEISVAIPAGVESGEMIRLSGSGEAIAGGIPGDLYVKLHVHKDPVFTKEGIHINMTLPLKLSDALLGCERTIETLDGAVTAKIPAGVSHNEILRVREKGVPQERGRRGDLLITVSITLPKKLSRKARKMIEDLREEGI
ncbi:MAG TPA: molecular chaperone DnaJ [Candidatus Paceibacterota bacterium]